MSVAVTERSMASVRGAAACPLRRSGLEWSTVICGVALAVLTATDGTPGWQAARMLVVATVTAAAVIIEVTSPPRWRGRVAVIAGVPALAVAIGFSPYLAKGGPPLVRAATLLLAVAAIGLTAGGTAAATRGRRLHRRLATGVAVGVVTALVVFVTSPAVAATNVPRPDIDATPTDVGLAYQDVRLRTDDGVTLAGWYVPSANRAGIVLLHGAGSTRSDVLAHAAVLNGAGFGVLMVDARGHGDSGGRAMDFGWHGDRDIAAATAYLAARPDVDARRIGAVGMSMGGEEALGATATNDVLRAVVAEGATARGAPDEAWLSDRYGIRGAVQEQLERVQDRVTDVLTDASVPASLRAAVATSGRTRSLLISAGNEPDEGHAASYIAAAAPDRVETWAVEGAGHADGLEVAPEAWAARVVAFLTDALLLPPR
jgi:dienelactone hydrolase